MKAVEIERFLRRHLDPAAEAPLTNDMLQHLILRSEVRFSDMTLNQALGLLR